jgi:drug/metabolite transporter, DME family
VRWSDRAPRAQIFVAAVCFGTTGTAQAQWRPADVSPVGVGSVRIVVGAILLCLVARRGLRAVVSRGTIGVLLAGGIGVAVYQLSFFAAVDRTGVGVGTVVAIGSGPAMAGVLGRLVNREALTVRWATATGLTVAGVGLLGLGAGDDASLEVAGVILAVVAGAGYASYAVLAKRLLLDGHQPEPVMAATFGVGAVLLLPVLLASGVSWLAEAEGLLLALYLGAVPTALAYVLFARGLRSVATGEAATLTLAEPLTAAALGVLILSERPSGLAVAGAAVVLAGLLVVAGPGRSRGEPIHPEPVV